MNSIPIKRSRPWLRRDSCRRICGDRANTEISANQVPDAYPTIRATLTRDALDDHDIASQTVLIELRPDQIWLGLPGHPTAYDADGWRVLLEYHDPSEQEPPDVSDPNAPGWDCHVWGDPSDEDAQRLAIKTITSEMEE